MKEYKKVIIGIIIGVILASGISVYATATYIYNAMDVGYNNTSVSSALDDLYSKANELNTLKSNISQTDATANDILNGKKAYTTNGIITGTYAIPSGNTGAYGDFIPTDLTTKHINVGFRPSKVIIISPTTNVNYYVQYIYNSYGNDTMEALYIDRSKTTDTLAGVLANYNKSNIGFSIDNTGFYYKPVSADNKTKTYWFAIK